jgi:hypothetical protein
MTAWWLLVQISAMQHRTNGAALEQILKQVAALKALLPADTRQGYGRLDRRRLH